MNTSTSPTSPPRRLRPVVASAVLVAAAGAAVLAAAAPASAAPGSLTAGACLAAGSSLSSPSGLVALQVQTDANLVERVGGAAAWTTGTAGQGTGDRLCLQTDGNLVLRNTANAAVWQTGTASGGDGSYLMLQDDGNLVLRRADASVSWKNNVRADTLKPGAVVGTGQSLVSAGGGYTLTPQSDGNLVTRNTSTHVAGWTTGTTGHTASRLTLQTDGNIVLRDTGGAALWSSGTAGKGGVAAVLQTDGDFVLRNASGTAIWSSTHGILNKGQAILAAAQSQFGQMYTFAGGDIYGPTNPPYPTNNDDITGFDCSGLSLYSVYKGVGKQLPHSAQQQFTNRANWGGVLVTGALQPGDLVFFGSSATTIHHVGVAAGGGNMVDAPDYGYTVGTHNIASYGDYFGAVRFTS